MSLGVSRHRGYFVEFVFSKQSRQSALYLQKHRVFLNAQAYNLRSIV